MLTAKFMQPFPPRSASRSSPPRLPPSRAIPSPDGLPKSERWVLRMFPSTQYSPQAPLLTLSRHTKWMSTAATATLLPSLSPPPPARQSPLLPPPARASRLQLRASFPAKSRLTASLFSRFTTAATSIRLLLTAQRPMFTTAQLLTLPSRQQERATPSPAGTSKFPPPCPQRLLPSFPSGARTTLTTPLTTRLRQLPRRSRQRQTSTRPTPQSPERLSMRLLMLTFPARSIPSRLLSMQPLRLSTTQSQLSSS